VRFDDALHEFDTITGVTEDVTDIILNLKDLVLTCEAEEPVTLRIDARGPAEVKAGDIQTTADIEILNKDLHIATLNRDGDLRMEVEINGGRGYVSADSHGMTDRPIGVIPIDSLFSPVTKVNYTVEATRLGQRIDYDKLTLEVWTDGSILPNDAVSMSSKILRDHFSLLISFEEEPQQEEEAAVDEDKVRIRRQLDKSVEELELSVRSSNCLRAAEIKTIGELVQKGEAEMLKFRNFGRKSLKEIQDILAEMGLHFGMDVSPYYENKPSARAEV
jgi:DNA-directed RNA polymerase subunit alpha